MGSLIKLTLPPYPPPPEQIFFLKGHTNEIDFLIKLIKMGSAKVTYTIAVAVSILDFNLRRYS
jgi:hypothetical protein